MIKASTHKWLMVWHAGLRTLKKHASTVKAHIEFRHPKLATRRGVLKSLGGGLVMTLMASVPFALSRALTPSSLPTKRRQRRPFIRPPGALRDSKAFVSACIGCGLCGEICPPKCIQFHKRDGGLLANTPFIDPAQMACTLCGKCMEICPTEALSIVERQDVNMGVAQIDQTACYPWVDRGICGACVSICPLGEKAIGFKMWNQYRPIVREGCVGCGLCVEVCPHPSLPIWIKERSTVLDAKQRA